MEDNPKVSVIIVNFNGKHHLEGCLSSLEGQSFRDFEVVFVDNGSVDGSVDYVARNFPWVRVVANQENRGFCGGNNDGIANARGELLFLLNNDTELEPHCLERLVGFMEDAKEDCIGAFPLALFYHAPSIINSGGVVWNGANLWRDHRIGLIDSGRLKTPEQVFGAMFVAVMLRKDPFVEMGGFDEAMFTYGEDFDISYRANALGYRFFLVPEARLYHKFRASSQEGRDPLWSFYLYLRNYLYMLLKNLSWRELWAVKGFMARIYWLNIYWAFTNREWRRLWIALKALIALGRRAMLIAQWRRFMRSRRKVPDFAFWDMSDREPHSIFCYCGGPVLSLLNVKTALKGTVVYRMEGKDYIT